MEKTGPKVSAYLAVHKQDYSRWRLFDSSVMFTSKWFAGWLYASSVDKRLYIQACHVLGDHVLFCVENKTRKEDPPWRISKMD